MNSHGCRGDSLLEVLGEAAISVEPRQRPLDDPTAREDNEALGRIGPFDDLDGSFADPARAWRSLSPAYVDRRAPRWRGDRRPKGPFILILGSP
jgi:hypothetical protein